ncbi:hypothetical protein [Burkholderia sp. S-53]|uniref:hypothetical protein n=1 Tax=Burkholderia sp. S-53 TaxID=2906514 RepID=UPI0021CF909D|nr:hypothetical protein [Burkholderia sp. S-53]UXU91427.1 hypothetical protein LXM88_24990 [Burkholderia sp. S-53]
MRLKLVIATLPFLFGCATQQALMTETTSGYPETTFEGATLPDVQNLLIGRCSTAGAMVTETNPNMVICSRTLQGQQAILAQMLLGNSYSTTPVDRIRFVLDSNASDVHVTAYEWVETTMPFGQVNRAELTSNNSRNALQSSLDRLNREYGYSHPKKAFPVAVGQTLPVTAKICTSYNEAGPGNIVKHYQKGDSLTIFERSTIYLRVSANGAPQEWVVDGACTR